MCSTVFPADRTPVSMQAKRVIPLPLVRIFCSLHLLLRRMGDALQAAVERAIETMWDRYGEPLSLDDIADTAILSKFYFSRVFRTLTGTSPGRFLSVIRLYQAKALLLKTTLSVTEISYQVGYNSLGTFTSRFTRSVGISPTRYRALATSGYPAMTGALPPPVAVAHLGAVRGSVSVPDPEVPSRIYVAAFKDPIVQGLPVACDVLDGPGDYALHALPEDTWHLRVAVVAVRDVDPRPWHRRPLSVGAGQPLVVRKGQTFGVDLHTRRLGAFDLPILLALPELDSWQLPQRSLAARASSQ
jgi:AraC family transcriptional regulator